VRHTLRKLKKGEMIVGKNTIVKKSYLINSWRTTKRWSRLRWKKKIMECTSIIRTIIRIVQGKSWTYLFRCPSFRIKTTSWIKQSTNSSKSRITCSNWCCHPTRPNWNGSLINLLLPCFVHLNKDSKISNWNNQRIQSVY